MSKRLNTREKPEFLVEAQTNWSWILILLTVALIAILGLYYYEYHYMPSQEIPLLASEPGPTRIKAEGVNEVIVPNVDKFVYDAIQPKGYRSSVNVSVAPEPEQPIHITEVVEVENHNTDDDVITNIIAGIKPNTPSDNTIHETRKTLKIISVTNDLGAFTTDTPRTTYKLQVTSTRSSDEAEREWQKLQKSHSKFLKDLPYVIKSQDVDNSVVFYRLLVGDFKSFSQAKALCKKLTNAKQSCVIVKE